MPKVKLATVENENKRLVLNIKKAMLEHEVTVKELALAARVTERTLYNRFKHPNEFKLSELKLIAKKLHISLPELFSAEKECRYAV